MFIHAVDAPKLQLIRTPVPSLGITGCSFAHQWPFHCPGRDGLFNL